MPSSTFKFNRDLVAAEWVVVMIVDIRIFQVSLLPRVFVMIENCFPVQRVGAHKSPPYLEE